MHVDVLTHVTASGHPAMGPDVDHVLPESVVFKEIIPAVGFQASTMHVDGLAHATALPN